MRIPKYWSFYSEENVAVDAATDFVHLPDGSPIDLYVHQRTKIDIRTCLGPLFTLEHTLPPGGFDAPFPDNE